jgi:hypothetical protein
VAQASWPAHSQLRKAKSRKRPRPPLNQLNPKLKPPLQNSPLGSFIRAPPRPRPLTPSPSPRPRSGPVASFVRAPIPMVGSFIRVAPSPVPRGASPVTLSPAPSLNRSQLRPQRLAAPPDMPKSPPHPACRPFNRPKCARQYPGPHRTHPASTLEPAIAAEFSKHVVDAQELASYPPL